jgi:hypothetical protein
MRHRSIFLIILLTYPFVSFAENNSWSKPESETKENIKFLDSLEIINLIPLDSVATVPGNQNQNLRDTSNQIITEPVKTTTDTNKSLINEPFVIPSDSSGLIQMEKIIPSDSSGLLQNEKIIPLDSAGLIQTEIVNPGDSLALIKIQKITEDSLNVIKIENRRIEYRSVYTDSTDINYKPPRKIIMFQWISDEKRDTVIRYKNIIGINLFYGIYTYGFGFGIFRRLSNDADFIANINLSYVFDRHTENEIDSSVAVKTLQHESRMYPIVFNVGLEKYFMQNRIDWKVKPVLIFGFAPTVIITTPYELSLFSSLKKIQLSYGIGVFAALGFDWQAFQKVGINLTARYSFIPVIIGRDIYYYTGFKVKNIGGFYVNLGITLLKEYFGKK